MQIGGVVHMFAKCVRHDQRIAVSLEHETIQFVRDLSRHQRQVLSNRRHQPIFDVVKDKGPE